VFFQYFLTYENLADQGERNLTCPSCLPSSSLTKKVTVNASVTVKLLNILPKDKKSCTFQNLYLASKIRMS